MQAVKTLTVKAYFYIVVKHLIIYTYSPYCFYHVDFFLGKEFR